MGKTLETSGVKNDWQKYFVVLCCVVLCGKSREMVGRDEMRIDEN